MSKLAKKIAFLILGVFILIARTSKYDFWILEQILGRNSKKCFFKKYFFDMKKFSEEDRKNIFRDQNIFGNQLHVCESFQAR